MFSMPQQERLKAVIYTDPPTPQSFEKGALTPLSKKPRKIKIVFVWFFITSLEIVISQKKLKSKIAQIFITSYYFL